MTVSSANRTALFIDGANLYSAAKARGFDIDYKRLPKEFQDRGTLVRAFYYTAVNEDEEFSSVRPLLDWLDYNGFTVVTSRPRNLSTPAATGRSRVAWTSNSQSMRWSSPTTSCCSPATEAFGHWSKPCSGAVFASRWSPQFRASLPSSPTICAARQTSSLI
jgi:hypothetical protein